MSRHLRRVVLLGLVLACPLALWPAPTTAQWDSPFSRPFVYGPSLRSLGPDNPSGWPWYPDVAEVRVPVAPRDEVFVDGYCARIVDNFNGAWLRLNLSPGGHQVMLYREGFRAVHQTVSVMPGSTVTLRYTMVPLAGGETEGPRPVSPGPPSAAPMGMRLKVYPVGSCS